MHILHLPHVTTLSLTLTLTLLLSHAAALPQLHSPPSSPTAVQALGELDDAAHHRYTPTKTRGGDLDLATTHAPTATQSDHHHHHHHHDVVSVVVSFPPQNPAAAAIGDLERVTTLTRTATTRDGTSRPTLTSMID
ncbi:hypothetical protein AAE478_006933 [Parahypoxylon ruwenzoriense]